MHMCTRFESKEIQNMKYSQGNEQEIINESLKKTI